MPHQKLLLFIPAYNCAPQIVRVLRKLNQLPPGLIAEALVLDNQSTDDTNQAAVNAIQEVTTTKATVARNHNNYGLGGSHKAAFAYAQQNAFSHVIVLHGDDQGDITDILPILNQNRHLQKDACLGSRFMKGSQTPGYSTFRTVGNHIFNRLFSLAAGKKVTDLGSGLNIFAEAVFTDPDVQRYSDDLRFNCYLLLGLTDKKRSFEFFPISWREEDQISNVRIVSQTIKTLAIVNEYLFRRAFFRQADHRAKPFEAYTFEVTGTNAEAKP